MRAKQHARNMGSDAPSDCVLNTLAAKGRCFVHAVRCGQRRSLQRHHWLRRQWGWRLQRPSALCNGWQRHHVYNTRFGTLSPTGAGTSISRNAGTLPWNIHLDANLSRSFAVPHHEAQSLAVNLRSTNLLNHTNVTAVGGVLGSPLFGTAYAADAGRRVEAGLRYSF